MNEKPDSLFFEETILPSGKEYAMRFSGNRPDFPNSDPDNSDGGDNHDRKKKGNGYISVILLAVAFVFVVTLTLYFFVFRNNTRQVNFSEQDLIYEVDTNYDGKPETNSQGYPDLTNWNHKNGTFSIQSTSNEEGIVLAGGSSASETQPVGKLASLMLNPGDSQIQMSISISNQVNDLYIVSGTFVNTGSSNIRTTYSFTVNVHENIYTHYLQNILNYTEVLDSKSGQYNRYYGSDGTPVYIAAQTTNNISSWLIPLIMDIAVIGLIIYFVNRMYKSMSGSMGPGSMSGFVDNVARKESTSKIRFSDVAGCDEAKAELVEMVDYFHNGDKYTRLGAKLPHGVLLVGPPGTGKTLLAKAVAGEADVPFYSISGSDFVEMYVGVGASRVRSLFKTAKSNAPCLIFIDEIDAVGRQRGAGIGGGNDEREQTLNELLVEMDGFEDNSGIIVMAATNRSDVLDPALTRPGRFDRTITVDLPDQKGRAAILRVHSRNKRLAPDVSFDSIASRTIGFSGAELASIMNDAAILAVRANRDSITSSDIDEAIDRQIAGPAKRTHLDPGEKKQVAYHEAGHAVIGLFLPYSDVVQKITIIPRGRTGGHVLMTPAHDHFLLTKNQMLARITGYLGGRTSEEIFFGDVSTGASNDIEVATQLARSMVTEYGMSELGPIQYEKPGGSAFLGRDYTSAQSNYSTQVAFEIDKAVRKIIEECHEKAQKLLSEHKEDVELIANTLIANETITSEQISYLIKNRKLPPEEQHLLDNRKAVKNPKNIFLYTGYDPFYLRVDDILEHHPNKLVIVVAMKDGRPLSDDNFRQACLMETNDISRIGVLFVDSLQFAKVSLSVESFASHLEDYSGVSVLLVKTDDASLLRLQDRFTVSAPKEDSVEVKTAPTAATQKNPTGDEKKEENDKK